MKRPAVRLLVAILFLTFLCVVFVSSCRWSPPTPPPDPPPGVRSVEDRELPGHRMEVAGFYLRTDDSTDSYPSLQTCGGQLDLVQRHRLAGIAVWRLGYERPLFWETLDRQEESAPGA